MQEASGRNRARDTCTSDSRWEEAEVTSPEEGASPHAINSDGPVIMVDDNDSDIVLARFCYQDAQVPNPFVGMHSGAELLDYLESVIAQTAAMPAIVLLDINMPGMSGFEVLTRMRSRPEFRRMPIIMMLTHSDYPEDVSRARDLGADGFQTKPFLVREYVAFFASLRHDSGNGAARSS